MILFPLIIVELNDENDRAFMQNIFIDFQKIMYLKAYSIMKNTHDAEDIPVKKKRQFTLRKVSEK